MFNLFPKVILTLTIVMAQNAFADNYRLYCNTLIQTKAITQDWTKVSAVEGMFKANGYAFTRDADLRGSDFKQTSMLAPAPHVQSALDVATKGLCDAEKIKIQAALLNNFKGGKVNLDATISQCAYVYNESATVMLKNFCRSNVLPVR